jgi:hypothetical protein
MGFFSFLKKKHEAPTKMEPLKLEMGDKPVTPSPIAPHTPEVPSFEPEPFRPMHEPTAFKEATAGAKDRDIELLSAKIDTLKAMLENISHRLDRMEQQQKEKRW